MIFTSRRIEMLNMKPYLFLIIILTTALLRADEVRLTKDFLDVSGISLSAKGGKPLTLVTEERRGPGGAGMALYKVSTDSAGDGGSMSWPVKGLALKGEATVSLFVLPQGRPLKKVNLEFLSGGKPLASVSRSDIPAGAWQQISEKITIPEPEKVDSVAVRFSYDGAGDDALLVCDFQLVEVSVAKSKAQTQSADLILVSAGSQRVVLDPSQGHSLASVDFDGIQLKGPQTGAFPTFVFLDEKGARKTVTAGSPDLKVSIAPRGSAGLAVTYEHGGTKVEVAYFPFQDRIHCEVGVISEGDWKLVEVGSPRMLSFGIGAEDYGIAADGYLLRAEKNKPANYRHEGGSDYQICNFSAAKVGNRILFFKPLTASNEIQLNVEQEDTGYRVAFGGRLFFRPSKTENPSTRLCSRMLAWQLESAGDQNRDGEVDWVDAGIAYRNRYIAPNPRKDVRLRDAYIYYHQEANYADLAVAAEKLDFAEGVWWFKRLIEDTGNADGFIYESKPLKERGNRADSEARILAAGSRVGPHYSIDAVDLRGGNWPEEFVKTGPDGKPMRYAMGLHYFDWIRSMTTGKFKPWMEGRLAAWQLRAGDSMMFDTFACYARQSYHPDYAATADLELAAKRNVIEWLRDEKGLYVAAEGAVEGIQDMISYCAGGLDTRPWQTGKNWAPTWPRTKVLLNQVIYNGSTYFAHDWYTPRNGTPNWAAGVLLCGKMWDWSTLLFKEPDTLLYMQCARRYFLQNIFWAQFADAFITDVEQKGTAYTISFDNGCVLSGNPVESVYAFQLQKDGVTYRNFTPFNNRGVMAVFGGDSFDVTVPTADDLEVMPSLPGRDQMTVEITRISPGEVRVKGSFNGLRWKQKRIREVAGKEKVEDEDADPILLLRVKGGSTPPASALNS